MASYDRDCPGLAPKHPFQERVAPTLQFLREGKPSRVLEAGCGNGHVTRVLASVPGFEVHCCDIAEPAEVPASARFHVQDLSQPLPYEDESFDGVVCTEVIEHLKAPFQALAEFTRVLRPGGYLLFTVPNFWNVRQRVRYLLTANLPQTHYFNPQARVYFRDNACPHINAMPLPIYEYGLASLGIELTGFRLGGHDAGSWLYWPLALLIRLLNLARKPRRRKRYMLAHTNHWRVLMGGEHIMLVGRKVGFDQVTYEVAPLRDLDRL